MMPPLSESLHYRITIRDARGRVIRRTRLLRSRSFLQQYPQHLRALMRFVDEDDVRDDTNTLRDIDASNTPFMDANLTAAASDEKNIVVGSGSTAVDIADFALATKIADGLGAGQLDYQAPAVDDFVVVGQTASWNFTRIFINSSGSPITVRETGIVVSTQVVSVGIKTFLIVRDVPSELTVPDGGSAGVEYTFSVTA